MSAWERETFARQESFALVVDGPVTADLERLRAALHAFLGGGRDSLVLRVAASDDTEAVRRDLEDRYQLFRRAPHDPVRGVARVPHGWGPPAPRPARVRLNASILVAALARP